MASNIASGAMSAPFGHVTAPSSTRAWANTAGSRSASNTVPSTRELSRNGCIRTSPVVASTKATLRRAPAVASTRTTRHGAAGRKGGTTPAVESAWVVLAGGIAPSPPEVPHGARQPIPAPTPELGAEGRRGSRAAWGSTEGGLLVRSNVYQRHHRRI